MGEKFYQLLKESVIVQSLITLILITTLCVNSILQHPPDTNIVALTWVVVGFWFGQKLNFYRAIRKE